MQIAVCIPVYGEAGLTDRVLDQLEAESAYVHTYICDNLGDYDYRSEAVSVVRPGTNLGWLRGTNHVWRLAIDMQTYDAFVLLNNDVVLSRRFIQQLYRAVDDIGASVVVPLYDRGFDEQIAYQGPANRFDPTDKYDRAFWMDGTCMLVTKAAVEAVGLLDEEHFGRYGWGASLDYGIRARRAGLITVVSWQAYLNHLESVTAKKVVPEYAARAIEEREEGMRAKYGNSWKVQLAPNRFKRVLYYIVQQGVIRSLARRTARSSIGRKLVRLLR